MGLLHIATHEVQFARDSVAVDGALIVDASTLLQCSFNGMCSPVHRGALALSRSSQERESDVGIFHERHRGKDAGEAMRLQQLQGFGPGTLRFVETLLPSQVGAAQPERMGERAMLGDLATHRYRAIQHFQRFCIAGTLCFDHCAHRRRPRLRVAVRSFVHDLLEAFGHHEHARLTHPVERQEQVGHGRRPDAYITRCPRQLGRPVSQVGSPLEMPGRHAMHGLSTGSAEGPAPAFRLEQPVKVRRRQL
jgi:hypothetical protein